MTAAREHGAGATWVRPCLERMGTVAQVTGKVDNIGRNDGGKWPKRRT
ncbi:MAG: hypothetical protein ACYC3L_06735 [Gemmatimonadaceae bacterium]